MHLTQESDRRRAGAAPSSGLAHAAVTAEEAKKLGTTLTPIGAEKAGNKAGTIPAYTGGLTTPPAGFKAGRRHPARPVRRREAASPRSTRRTWRSTRPS